MADFTYYVGKRRYTSNGQELTLTPPPVRGYVPGLSNAVEDPFGKPTDFVSEADREAGVTASTGASVTDAEMAAMRKL